MKLRKATSSLVFAFIAAVTVGSMMAGCSSEEFECPRKTLATRSTMGTEPIPPETPTDTIAENSEFLIWVPDLENNDGVEFEITVSWSKGACNRPWNSGDQSHIRRRNVRQVGTENRFEQMYKEMIFEDSETGVNGLRYEISREDYSWNSNFSGMTVTFDYTVISPEKLRWNGQKGGYETVRDTFGPRHISYPVIDSRFSFYVTSPNL